MRKLFYRGNAIRWTVEPEIDGTTVTVPDFTMTVMGVDYPVTGGVFTLEDQDAVYMTPSGLVQENAEAPGEKTPFSETGACYWLASRAGDEILILEAGA